MVDWTTRLNTPGQALSALDKVHALTDVTGFGLAGHLLEICRGSKLGAVLDFDRIPFVPEALEWAKQGVATGASDRNWKGYGQDVALPVGAEPWKQKLVTDPQTSGGLLVACAPEAEQDVLRIFQDQGFADARAIGTLVEGSPRISFL
jgi:selenide,water dikinase